MKTNFEILRCGYGRPVLGAGGGVVGDFGCHHHPCPAVPVSPYPAVKSLLYPAVIALSVVLLSSCSTSKTIEEGVFGHRESHFGIADSISASTFASWWRSEDVEIVIDRSFEPISAPNPSVSEQNHAVSAMIHERITLSKHVADSSRLAGAISEASQSTFDASLDTCTTRVKKSQHSAVSEGDAKTALLRFFSSPLSLLLTIPLLIFLFRYVLPAIRYAYRLMMR